jgi:hypothetical protein
MNVDQSNLKEATKYSQYYTYKVSITKSIYNNKQNYFFKLDNNFFKKLFSKPYYRLSFKTSIVPVYNVIFTYKPKSPKLMIDDTYIHFQSFNIVVSTEDCYEFIFYHIPNNGENCENLKGIYVLNIDMVVKKLQKILDDTNISEKGRINMVNSLTTHLGNVESSDRFYVDEYEEFAGFTENDAMVIIDDYNDEELSNSLIEYLF